MISELKDNRWVQKCCCCNYEYIEYENSSDNEPFIEMSEQLIYEKHYEYEGSIVKRITYYACPKCGALQVDSCDIY